jgi:Flp pilus assembly protein TadD
MMTMRWLAITLAGAILVLGTIIASDSSASRVPPDDRALAEQASSDFGAGHYDAAAAKFQAIIDKHPDSLYAWSNLGVTRFQQGELDEAVRAFKHAVHLNPRDAFAQTDLGMCYFEQGKYSAAIPPLERAESLNPDNSNIHAVLAHCYAKVGRTDDARNELQAENLQQMDTYR